MKGKYQIWKHLVPWSIHISCYFATSILSLRISSSVYVCLPRSLSLFAPNALLTRPRLKPTRNAAITVPTPTLPRLCMHIRQVITYMTTIEQSNPIFTLENSIFVTSDTACMTPSPASGIRSAGR